MEAAESTRASLHKSEAVSGKKKRRSKDWKVHGRGDTNPSGSGGSGKGGGGGGGGRSRRPPILLNNPKRGAPGIILTCDRGRESKCQREALQIIEHYYAKQQQQQQQQHREDDGSSSHHHETKDTTEESKTLSLEEELKQLQEEDQIKKEANFGIFDTGCSGLVFALCTVPGSEMIPPVKLSKISKSAGGEDPPHTKRQKLDSGTLTETTKETEDTCRPLSAAATVYSTQWDPVPIVRQILQDIEQDTGKDAPSSRFVSRMIPLQATCYVSEEEMQIASRSLIQRYFPSSAVTFAVAVKRRFCQSALPKAKIIDIMAAAVLEKVPTCKVDLDHPEVTVVMEICKTMCGLSVIPKCHEHFKNFNLAEAREKAQPT